MEKTSMNMSCGQTDLYPKCLAEMAKQLGTPLYYPPYWKIEVEAIDMLKKLFNTQNDIILLTGSATYGEEAAMLTALEPGDKALTVNSGTFGQVLTDLAGIVGAKPIEIKIEHGKAVNPEEIRKRLKEDNQIKMVAVVYVETSMGTLNPVDEIGEMLKEFPDVLYMVDAVSALGAIEVRVDDWGIDLCCSSSQKCINAPQGVAIVAVSEKAWQVIENRKTPVYSLCLDLTVWRRYHHGVRRAFSELKGEKVEDIAFKAGGKAAHGPSPSYVLVKALRASLEEIFEEGPENVFRRHRTAGKAVREAVRAMGLQVLADEKVAAPMCTTVVWPEGFDTGRLCKIMQQEKGIALAGNRIGNMGFVADREYILATLSALEELLPSMGHKFPPGVGVEAAKRVFDEAERIKHVAS